MDAPEEIRQIDAVAQAIWAGWAGRRDRSWASLTSNRRNNFRWLARSVLRVPAIADALERDAKVAEWVDDDTEPEAPTWMGSDAAGGWGCAYAAARSDLGAALYPETGRPTNEREDA